MTNHRMENGGMRQAFDRMRKVPHHAADLEERHGDVRKEWVVEIIFNPYHRYEEYDGDELRTILVGRVPESRQWIKVVFVGTPEDGAFLTAYRDRRLNKIYGGGPWQMN